MNSPAEYFDFLLTSPSAYHTVATLADRLRAAGFVELDEKTAWRLQPGGRYFVARSGRGLAAFRTGSQPASQTGWALACAHTDSPALKVKLASQSRSGDLLKVGVEVYGGPILSTWLDRDLGLSGRLLAETAGKLVQKLVRLDQAVAVIPNLAIHFNRDVNKGVALDPQTQLSALVHTPGRLEDLVLQAADLSGARLLEADLFFHEVQAPARLGDSGLYTAARIDNLAGCHAVLQGLLHSQPAAHGQLAVFFDAEEVGSTTEAGADSVFLPELLERLCLAEGGDRQAFFQAKARSFLLSVDAAHALHPNYADRHDPAYSPRLGGGPVIKTSGRNAYASNAATAARFGQLCQAHGVPVQHFIIRSDLPGGMTVGPMTAAGSGLPTVDIGEPMLAMHSARETGDLRDHEAMIRALAAFFDAEPDFRL